MSGNGSSRQKQVLVIGAGIAGAATARQLARAGLTVHLIERAATVGGRVADMGCKATDVCLRCNVCVALEQLRSVQYESGVEVRTETVLAELGRGRNGSRYRAVLAPVAGKGCSIVDVEAVVVATGHAPYDPVENANYSYGRLANVITGTEAESQLAHQPRLTRPSDDRTPDRVAFIQCVGSRTEEVYRRPEDTSYCSTVCCAYALRTARRLLHACPETDITVFHMDIQHFGKGFQQFCSDCEKAMHLVRSRPYELRAAPDDGVRVRFAPMSAAGEDRPAVDEETFDLVVLAVGIRPRTDARDLADNLGIPLDEHGFFGLKTAAALSDLQREDLYAVGTCEAPRDIAGCIGQAQAVSAIVLSRI